MHISKPKPNGRPHSEQMLQGYKGYPEYFEGFRKFVVDKSINFKFPRNALDQKDPRRRENMTNKQVTIVANMMMRAYGRTVEFDEAFDMIWRMAIPADSGYTWVKRL